MELKYDCLNILENSDLSWIRYNLELKRNGLCDYTRELKGRLLGDERIVSLLDEASKWPAIPLSRHNDAKHIIHKIHLLLDFGLNYQDKQMKDIAEKILANQSEEGAFLTLLNISKNFGGSGEDTLQWIICDFPILLYILIKLGLENDKRVTKAIDFLVSISSDNGWRCVGALEKFRGPGKKTDYCPYGTLVSLRTFSLLPQYHEEDFIRAAIDSILKHWKNQKERKVYMFGIGTDFRKLKYPNIWFDIVHVVRVLSGYEYARRSREFKEMTQIIVDKQQENGGFIPESIYMAYKGWDFGQKKAVSETLTYEIYEIFYELTKAELSK